MSRWLCQIARSAGVCLFAVISLSGCEDASSDPLGVILSERGLSELAVDAGLPSLESLAAEAALETSLDGWIESWRGSWERSVLEGREVRLRAYNESADPLADALGGQAVVRTVLTVEEAVAAAASLDGETLGARLSEQVDLARAAQEQAVLALEQLREADALVNALIAVDLLREVGPESVVRVLIAQAATRFERLSAQGAEADVSSEDLGRGRRLLQGARLALEAGEYALAIRRAYYACQVLGLQQPH